LCQVAKQLLAEKLIDYYEEQVRSGERTSPTEESLPTDQHELLYHWEAECAENCGGELRQFADFVASILMAVPFHEEDDGGRDT
jgi:hypothetical protein